jgi:hypothetical protein
MDVAWFLRLFVYAILRFVSVFIHCTLDGVVYVVVVAHRRVHPRRPQIRMCRYPRMPKS